MNINQKIAELGPGGLPRYNRKINELVEAVNWLLGMRTASGSISDGGRGPVIDTGALTATTGAQPWSSDPDGHAAGWMQVLVLNPNQNGPANQSGWIQWIWCGPTELIGALPWGIDPSGNAAGWVNCPNNAFWGTGACSGAAGNFQQALTLWSGSQPPNSPQFPSYASPQIWTSNPQNEPITPPASTPAFYLELSPAPVSAGLPNAPCLSFSTGVTSADGSLNVIWELVVQYEGATVLSYSGSFVATFDPTGGIYINLDPTGWIYDPAGLPGYAQGSNKWIWKYPGSVSSDPNPTVTQTLIYSVSPLSYRTAGLVEATVIFLTA